MVGTQTYSSSFWFYIHTIIIPVRKRAQGGRFRSGEALGGLLPSRFWSVRDKTRIYEKNHQFFHFNVDSVIFDGFIIICYKLKAKRRREGVKSVKKMAAVLRKIIGLKEGDDYEITLLAFIKRKKK